MPEYFSIFGVPRSPWLDMDLLKQRFLELSASCHPDKAVDKAAASAAFTTLNTGYNVLRNARDRILHLLEQEGVASAPHVQTVPPEVIQFFGPVGAVTKDVDEILERKRKATSPMLAAQLFEEGLDWTDRLQVVQQRLADAQGALEEEIQRLVPQYRNAETRAGTLKRLGEIAAALGFLDRWQKQLQERFGQLAI